MKTLGISISLKTVDAPAVNAAGVFLLVGVVGRRKAKKWVSRFLVGINFRHSNVMPNFAVP